MIDLLTIQKMRKDNLEKEIEQRRISSTNKIENEYEYQKIKFLEAESDKERAEHDFPKILKYIEDKIKSQIERGESIYYYQYANTVHDTYLVKMLLDVLPLHGFICRFVDSKLEILW